jgi:hypothetical protein
VISHGLLLLFHEARVGGSQLDAAADSDSLQLIRDHGLALLRQQFAIF